MKKNILKYSIFALTLGNCAMSKGNKMRSQKTYCFQNDNLLISGFLKEEYIPKEILKILKGYFRSLKFEFLSSNINFFKLSPSCRKFVIINDNSIDLWNTYAYYQIASLENDFKKKYFKGEFFPFSENVILFGNALSICLIVDKNIKEAQISNRITHLNFCDNKTMFTYGNKEICLWDIKSLINITNGEKITPQKIIKLELKEKELKDIHFNLKKNYFVTQHYSHIKLWNHEGKLIRLLNFLPSFENRKVRFNYYMEFRLKHRIKFVLSNSYNVYDDLLLVYKYDVKAWDMVNSKFRWKIHPMGKIEIIKLSPNKKFIGLITRYSIYFAFHLFNFETGKEIYYHRFRSSDIFDFNFSAKGIVYITSSSWYKNSYLFLNNIPMKHDFINEKRLT